MRLNFETLGKSLDRGLSVTWQGLKLLPRLRVHLAPTQQQLAALQARGFMAGGTPWEPADHKENPVDAQNAPGSAAFPDPVIPVDDDPRPRQVHTASDLPA